MPFARALRRLLRHPATLAPALLLMALAVGVGTALFAYLGALLWPRVEAPASARVVSLYVGTASEPRARASHREYELLRRQERGIEPLVAYSPFGASLAVGEETRFAWSYAVSGDYFELFAARPLRGRLLQPQDDRPGAAAVAVLHPAFWRARLGGDPGVVGRTLQLNGRTVTVVGVAPEGFQGHGHATAVYVPLALADALTGTARSADPEARWLQLIGRLAPGWTAERARRELAAAARAADAEHALDGGPRRLDVVRADRHDEAFGPDPQLASARALFGGALLFLLLAAASVTNLLLARTAARQREWGIRAALGEPRLRMAGRVLAESATVCVAGGALGLPVALALAARLEGYTLTSPGGLGGWSEWSEVVRLDARALAFALAAASAVALLAGAASLPAALALGRRRGGTLLLTARGAAGESAGLRGRRLLVAVQVALSLALCLGGGLLARSLQRASEQDPGFATGDLYLATLYAPKNLDGGTTERLYGRLLDEMDRLPGARHPSLAHQAPLAGWFRSAAVATAERPDALLAGAYDLVSPGYFTTLGLPLRAGRAIDRRDRSDAAPAVVIGETLAQRLWGSTQAAVGRRLVAPGSPHETWEVVGVAADLRSGSLTEPAPPLVWFPVAQRPHSRMTLLLRSPRPESEVAAQVRAALHRVHPGLAVVEVTTGEVARGRLLLPQQMHAEIASLFASLGLAIAMVGLFGLLSHAVVAGARELAVRTALGATPSDLLRLVAGNALRIVGGGALLGIALWIPLAGLIRGLLFGVAPLDPATLLAAPALLALAGLAAAALPALRAARIDPAASLR
jgi:predicted permease